MRKFFPITFPGLLLLILYVLPLQAQGKFLKGLLEGETNPPIGELESEYGLLPLTDEFLVELEIARMERALREEDSLGFADGFSDDAAQGLEATPPNAIAEFMGYFIRRMRSRGINAPAGERFAGTFDFALKDISLERRGNKIDLSGVVEFSFLTVNDSISLPMSSPFQAGYHLQQERWKIKQARGLFEFFIACIQRLVPGEAIPAKYRQFAPDASKAGIQPAGKEGMK